MGKPDIPVETRQDESVGGRPAVFFLSPFEMNYGASIRETLGHLRKIQHLRRSGFVDGRIGKVMVPARRTDRVMVYPGVIRFTDAKKSTEVVNAMHSLGLHPTTLLEFLTLGIKVPEAWQRFSLAGLGTRLKEDIASANHEMCVSLEGNPDYHTLLLLPYQRIWEPERCFPFIGESTPVFDRVGREVPLVDDITIVLDHPYEEQRKTKRPKREKKQKTE